MEYIKPETLVFRMVSEAVICASVASAPGSIESISQGEIEE